MNIVNNSCKFNLTSLVYRLVCLVALHSLPPNLASLNEMSKEGKFCMPTAAAWQRFSANLVGDP